MMWTIKNIKTKSTPHMRIWWVGWRRDVFRKRKKKLYKDANQTKNFTGVKTGNGLYYGVKNTI